MIPVNEPLLDAAVRENVLKCVDGGWISSEGPFVEEFERRCAEYHGRRVGGFGILSCFSFYANKIITTGEGGMVLARDRMLYERLRSGRNLSFRADRRFLHSELGHNYRLTNLQAAVGVAQVQA